MLYLKDFLETLSNLLQEKQAVGLAVIEEGDFDLEAVCEVKKTDMINQFEFTFSPQWSEVAKELNKALLGIVRDTSNVDYHENENKLIITFNDQDELEESIVKEKTQNCFAKLFSTRKITGHSHIYRRKKMDEEEGEERESNFGSEKASEGEMDYERGEEIDTKEDEGRAQHVQPISQLKYGVGATTGKMN